MRQAISPVVVQRRGKDGKAKEERIGETLNLRDSANRSQISHVIQVVSLGPPDDVRLLAEPRYHVAVLPAVRLNKPPV